MLGQYTASSKCSDEPAHTRIIARTFTTYQIMEVVEGSDQK